MAPFTPGDEIAAWQLRVVLDVLDREAGTVADGKFRVAESVLGIAEIGEKIGLRLAKRFRSNDPHRGPFSEARGHESQKFQRVGRGSTHQPQIRAVRQTL